MIWREQHRYSDYICAARRHSRTLLHRKFSVRPPADGPTQEGIAERYERRYVLVVLAIAVPSSRKLVEMGFVPHGLQLRRHLAGVAWMDAVIAAAGRDQDRRIGLAWRRHVIGGEASEECPILRLVGIAVFVDRPRAGG